MKKNYISLSNKKHPKREDEVVAPAESTLEFLKLLARTYCFDKSLPHGLNEVCVN